MYKYFDTEKWFLTFNQMREIPEAQRATYYFEM